MNKNSKSLVEICEVTSFSEDILDALKTMFTQLTTAELNFSGPVLKAILSSENSTMIIAKDHSQSGKIVGTLTFVTFRIPTGHYFRIEDVVVDQSARGKGVGRKLMEYAINEARKIGVDNIDLTSAAHRVAANQLYRSLGFQIKDTNVYRLE